MRVLVTGVSGFAGSHLAEFILTQHPDAAVYGTYRWRSPLDNLEDLRRRGSLDVVEGAYEENAEWRESSRRGRLTLLHCELTDRTAVERLVRTVRPDRVFHLAARSFVGTSFLEPVATFETNVLAQVHLLEALRALGGAVRVLVAGSSEEYGLVREDEVPIAETAPFRPLSPYAVSKVAQDLLGCQYHRSYGMHVVVTRAFNHTGPRRGQVFATSSFARQIAEAEAGAGPGVVRVGDLEARRDWHDVRDTVRAYWMALERGTPGEAYNVGSGKVRRVRDVLEVLLGLSGAKLETREDPARLRPSDVPILCADVTKLRERTGWEPTIPLDRTLADLLTYWRKRVAPDKVN